MKAILMLLVYGLVPTLLWGQQGGQAMEDSVSNGTITVRRATFEIKGRVMLVYDEDSSNIRNATVRANGENVFTDGYGRFTITVPKLSPLPDSLDIYINHQNQWDTIVKVAYAPNDRPHLITRNITTNNNLGGGGGNSRLKRRRELLKRIFLPWMWFRKNGPLPPKQ